MKNNVSKRILIIVFSVCLFFAVGISTFAADITWSVNYSSGNEIRVHFYNTGYSNPYIYCYADNYEVSSWSGEKMSDDGNGWYSYTIHDLKQARVIFSDNGSNQNPGIGEEGFLVTRDRWYCNDNWYDKKPDSTIVHYYDAQNWNNVNIYYYQDGLIFPDWPGSTMQYETDGWYRYEMIGFSNPRVIFSNNGNNQIPGQDEEGFSVSGEMWYKDGQWYDSNPIQYKKVKVHYYNSDSWDNVKLYYYDTGTDFNEWPGVSMASEGDGWYVYEIKCINNPKVIFSNNGNNQIPPQGDEGFTISSEKWYKDGKWYNSKPSTEHKKIKVHYYNYDNWNDIKLYYYDTGTDDVQWPGVSMISEGDDWYCYEIDCVDDPKVIFNDNGNNQIPTQDGFVVTNESWYRNGSWYNSRPTDITVYFAKPSDWNEPNIYYYIADNDTGPSWPGVPMQNIGSGWYKYTITRYSSAKVLFNDGINQMPASGQDGYDVTGVMWCRDGIWYKYNPDNIETNTTVGDLNGDGTVDENDSKLLFDYLTDTENNNLTEEQKKLADTNGDGVVDEKDKDFLDKFIDGEIQEFPVNKKLTNRDVSYEYDKLGRVTKVKYDDDNYIEYTYDKNGNITDVKVHGNVE